MGMNKFNIPVYSHSYQYKISINYILQVNYIKKQKHYSRWVNNIFGIKICRYEK
jgi:hypothetical protein